MGDATAAGARGTRDARRGPRPAHPRGADRAQRRRTASLPGGGDWDAELGEYLLDCEALREAEAADGRTRVVAFAREAFERARTASGWDPELVGEEPR